jgi:hypothetical protein
MCMHQCSCVQLHMHQVGLSTADAECLLGGEAVMSHLLKENEVPFRVQVGRYAVSVTCFVYLACQLCY